jgi:hypothetical protein
MGLDLWASSAQTDLRKPFFFRIPRPTEYHSAAHYIILPARVRSGPRKHQLAGGRGGGGRYPRVRPWLASGFALRRQARGEAVVAAGLPLPLSRRY